MNQRTFNDQSAATAIHSDSKLASNDYLNFMKESKLKKTDDSLFIAADEKMLRIKEIIDQIKNTNVSVLVSGESGTGKEVIAQALHEASDRAEKPFIAVNCAALPSNLLESELFGHEKGAFTGAMQRHIGKFELASGGTLLLDEITEMDTALQAKLLRALQEKEIERIGGNGPIPVETRIIATTNRNIMTAVSKGHFRQDLYYRLHVIHLEIPPLRQRPKDIELLANTFVERFGSKFKKNVELTPDALGKLKAHPWPGNVRELQNVIQRSVILAGTPYISASDLPIETKNVQDPSTWIAHMPIGRPLKELETFFILETLKHHKGNRTHAAKTLGISLRTLRNKINEFTSEGLDVMGPQTGRAQ